MHPRGLWRAVRSGEARPDWRIVTDLARRMGADWSYGHPREIMAEVNALTPSYAGITFDRLEEGGLCWPCPDAFHPGTPILHRDRFTRGKGLFTPTEYRPSLELPDADYPFVLTTGRIYVHYHTGTMTRRTQLLEREDATVIADRVDQRQRVLTSFHDFVQVTD